MPQRPEKMIPKALGSSWRQVFYAFLFSCFVNLLALTGPLFMLQVYDRVLGARSVETLVALTVLVAGLFILMALLDGARAMLMARYSVRFQAQLDPVVFKAELLDKSDAVGPARSSALRDLQSVRGLLASPVLMALFDIVWSPLFFASLFIFHSYIGWLGLFSGALLVTITVFNQITTRRAAQDAAQATEAAISFAERARAAKELVLTQGMLGDVSARYTELGETSLTNSVRARDFTGLFTAVTKSLRLFLQSAMLAVGAYLVIGAEMTAGAMIAGSILLSRALQPIEVLLNGWHNAQQGLHAWGRLAHLLKRTPARAVKHGLTRPQATLSLNNVAVAPIGSRQPSIAGVNFALNPGDALGVIGKSGAGKTSLGRAIVGYWPIVTGEIRLGGAELSQYDPDALGKLIGYLPQDVDLLPGTIAQNIARMEPNPDPAKIEAAAKRAFAHEMILALPQGYDTVISDRQMQLSGGQRQRVGLARALYGDPLLLVLDEPNSALDGEGTKALNAAVQEFKQTGRLVVLMTHRPAAIERCDKLLVLDGGRQRAFGPTPEVLAKVVKRPAQPVNRGPSNAG